MGLILPLNQDLVKIKTGFANTFGYCKTCFRIYSASAYFPFIGCAAEGACGNVFSETLFLAG